MGDASAAAGNCYRISTVSPLPTAPLTSVEVAGTHVDQWRVDDETGTAPLNLVTHEDLGDAAYEREADLYVARAVLADTATTASALSGVAIENLIKIVRLDSSFSYSDITDGALKDFTEMTDQAFPTTPDGSKEYAITLTFHGTQGGIDASGFAGLGVYTGPSGGSSTGTRAGGIQQNQQFVGAGQEFSLKYTFFVTPASGAGWTITAEGSPGAGVSWTIDSHRTGAAHAGYSERGGCFVEVREVTVD